MEERDTYQDVRCLPKLLGEMTEQEAKTVLGVLGRVLKEAHQEIEREIEKRGEQPALAVLGEAMKAAHQAIASALSEDWE
jgi:polyhydroxyalkanoate synthesis regulator phasin